MGDPTANKVPAEWVQHERAIARQRALIDARGRELDTRESELTALLNQQAGDLQAELDRRVAVERENLARRAEELTWSERSLERRILDLDEIERDARHEQAEVERLRGENAGRRAEVVELQERAAAQEETIERMMAAGQWLIRQRDELRAKAVVADRSPAPPKPGGQPRPTRRGGSVSVTAANGVHVPAAASVVVGVRVR